MNKILKPKNSGAVVFTDVDQVEQGLALANYIASREISTVVFLALATDKPILIEGPAGVGKTELAKAVATCLERRLIRLQCYEGLDEAKACHRLYGRAFCDYRRRWRGTW